MDKDKDKDGGVLTPQNPPFENQNPPFLNYPQSLEEFPSIAEATALMTAIMICRNQVNQCWIRRI